MSLIDFDFTVLKRLIEDHQTQLLKLNERVSILESSIKNKDRVIEDLRLHISDQDEVLNNLKTTYKADITNINKKVDNNLIFVKNSFKNNLDVMKRLKSMVDELNERSDLNNLTFNHSTSYSNNLNQNSIDRNSPTNHELSTKMNQLLERVHFQSDQLLDDISVKIGYQLTSFDDLVIRVEKIDKRLENIAGMVMRKKDSDSHIGMLEKAYLNLKGKQNETNITLHEMQEFILRLESDIQLLKNPCVNSLKGGRDRNVRKY